MTKREHDLSNGADCWCEPRVQVVMCGNADHGDGIHTCDEVNRIFIHACDVCEHNPCTCPENQPQVSQQP